MWRRSSWSIGGCKVESSRTSEWRPRDESDGHTPSTLVHSGFAASRSRVYRGGMTIAACYLSSEGVVLGADSTTTISVGGFGSEHHFNFEQKVFEIGEGDSLGAVVWGMGNIGTMSYRTFFAEVGDSLRSTRPADMDSAAERVAQLFWSVYSKEYDALLKEFATLKAIPTPTEEEKSKALYIESVLSGGLCLGGRCGSSRHPAAFVVTFGPDLAAAPKPEALAVGTPKFWGVPNLIFRMIYGIDAAVVSDILGSGKWQGTPEELVQTASKRMLILPRLLPIRDAIDWVYASIYATIKAMKFSHLSPVCGGPIEIAMITTDRPFRWVRHKTFAMAIDHGVSDGGV